MSDDMRMHAIALANLHRKNCPSTGAVYYFEDAEPDTVCLLEVDRTDIPHANMLFDNSVFLWRYPKGSTTESISTYSLCFAVVSEKEFEMVKAGELHLPENWNLAAAILI